MSFPRHREIYRSDVFSKPIEGRGRGAASRWSAPEPSQRTRRKKRAPLIVHDEFPVGYSSAGCSPAEPASASPTAPSMRWGDSAGNCLSANGNLSLISVPQALGPLQSVPGFPSPVFHLTEVPRRSDPVLRHNSIGDFEIGGCREGWWARFRPMAADRSVRASRHTRLATVSQLALMVCFPAHQSSWESPAGHCRAEAHRTDRFGEDAADRGYVPLHAASQGNIRYCRVREYTAGKSGSRQHGPQAVR